MSLFAPSTRAANAQLTASALPAPAPDVRIDIGDAVVTEGNSVYREIAFPVTINRSLPFDVSTKYSTKNISALAGSDYTPLTLNQVTIKAGQTATRIIVRVTSDKIEERDETFLVQLARPTSVLIGDADGIGTIKDDDYAGQISISDVSLSEGNSGTKIARTLVSLSTTPLHDVFVDFETKDEGAKVLADDYIARRGSLLFKAGRLVLSVDVLVKGDTLIESNERFFVRISARDYPITKSLGAVTIQNDDDAPPNGQITFESNRDGNDEIYRMNADGTRQTRLTFSAAAADYTPRFSPDGSKIVWVVSPEIARFQIWVMNADGTEPNKITAPFPNGDEANYDPAWSPDGSRIAFVSTRDSDSEIYVMNADGANAQRLTSSADFDTSPVWSPDGARIAWQSNRNGQPEIYAMNADGSDPTPLTMGRSSNTDPIFSPDGSRIVFTSYPNGYGQIWQMNADGSAQKPLFTSDFTDYSPCFSPDGNNLTWVSARGNDTNFQIYRGGANGSSPVRLTSSGQNRAPSWSIGSVPTPTTPLATPISPSAPAS